MNPEYIGLPEWAALVGVSDARARQWAAAGRIQGQIKPGRNWIVPRDAPRPERRAPGPRVQSNE